MKVLLLSYGFDGADVGEALIAYRWAKMLAPHVELTLLAFQRVGRSPLEEQIPEAEVVTWQEPAFLIRHAERLNAALKPAYPLLYCHVQKWLRAQKRAGRHFDLAHQIMPQAARYPSPFYNQDIPYIVGPLGGSLATPSAFAKEVSAERWFARLRVMDTWRFRYDPWLRRSYTGADLVLGVAPYMRERLAPIPLKRFEPLLELGIETLAPERSQRADRRLRLLHVGRGVRTKGLRDTIRALALLPDLPEVTLTSAGDGEEIALCRAEATRLGVAERVTFLGKIPHDEVEMLYRESDIFTFPSFREPAGGVLYEAMRWGLPVITVDYGGPAHITDDCCAFRLPVSTPEALARDIAGAIRTLHDDPTRRIAMGQAARARVAAEGLWKNKAKQLLDLYEDVLADHRTSALPTERGGKRE
jgi:glycosyltransferase involved in cell wall biosynthesis